MDDLVKLVGLGVLLAAVIIGGLLGYRIYNDEAMVWFVLIAGMGTVGLGVLALVLFLVYRTMLAGVVLMARSQEEQLMTARTYRTLGEPGQRQALPGGDAAALITAMFGGVPAQDAVHGAWQQPPQIEDGDQ